MTGDGRPGVVGLATLEAGVLLNMAWAWTSTCADCICLTLADVQASTFRMLDRKILNI